MQTAGGTDVAGLVLAAGAGRRMGTPKALIRDPEGVPWVVRAARLLAEAGCSPVVVVVGAAAEAVRAALSTEPVEVVEATDWTEGMGASLRAGLLASSGTATVVIPVDLPGLTSTAVRRLVDRAGPDALVRATYDGAPGHPVVIGRTHWAGVIASAHGDEGARAYLREHNVTLVECSDLANGSDVDTAEGLPPGHG